MAEADKTWWNCQKNGGGGGARAGKEAHERAVEGSQRRGSHTRSLDLLQGDPLTFSVFLEGCKNFALRSCGAGEEKRKDASWIPSFAMGHVVLLHGTVCKVLAI